MELSKHNILSKIHDSDEYFLVNLLSGNADILSSDEAENLKEGNIPEDEAFVEKGYVVDPAAEAKLFAQKYLDFIDSRDTDEVQLFYAPSYSCNFSCSYCYQDGYGHDSGSDPITTADAFFDYIHSAFKNRRKYITLFGGEPLLADAQNKDFLGYFTSKCRELGIELSVVTNGYNLAAYIPVLMQASIREIQLTLDGPEKIHNFRRPLKGGKGTFERIVLGVDAALEANIPVNLRVVLDRDNINSLPELAQFAIDKGWTASSLFKTQLGRNYELHYCQSDQSRLYSRIDLYKDLYGLVKQFPHILQFHKPAFSVSKFLFENGTLPGPLFDSCPGCKTEWAFDYTGKIYSCTATVGKSEEKLGNFYPEVTINKELVELWQDRDVLSIGACKHCNLRLACGGGCASVAFNREGNLLSPDCRPVKELLELGIAIYSAVEADDQSLPE
jgi:uncharacterized protein